MSIDLAHAADTAALPFTTSGSETSFTAEVREETEDFRVTEIPGYPPSGEGDHLFVRFEKRDLNTPEAVRRIARALDVDARGAGWAGLKDRRAVTEQWASFEHARLPEKELEIDGVRILETRYHTNKLRTGHLRGNRFDILLRGADAAHLEGCRDILGQLERQGVPSFFGPQRFGREGLNLVDANRWLIEGGRAPKQRFRRKMLVSSLQSAVFNELLSERVVEGTLDAAIDGDLLQKVESGGLFSCEDPETDTARARAFEITATGPMFGAKMRWPERDALAREEAALDRWGLTRESLSRFRKAGPGTRRPYRVWIRDVHIEAEATGLRVKFSLPAGAYATVVLRELLRREVR